MIAFARTPAGRHYLARFPVLNLDPKIVAAQDQLSRDFLPIYVRLQLELICGRLAQRGARDKDAPCPTAPPAPPRPPKSPPPLSQHGQ